MSFEPDIIVTGPEAPDWRMVVDAQLTPLDTSETERELKGYMTGVGFPIGMLVTPRKASIFRDRYLANPHEGIQKVGEFDIGRSLHFDSERAGWNAELDFENAVQSWIERFTTESGLRELPPDLRDAVKTHIVPVMDQGEVRAGHPRPYIAA